MEGWSEDIITADSAGTLDGLFRQRVRRTPDRVAYRRFDRAGGQWLDWTWHRTAEEVERWKGALAREPLERGDRVAVALRNGPEWVHFEQAALALGLVVVPLYTEDRPDNIAYILEDAAVKLLLLGDLGQWERVDEAVGEVASLRRVLVLNAGSEPLPDDPRLRPVTRWLAEPTATPWPGNTDPDSLATLVYTSGTTGRPKGVMLSHRNILSVAHDALINYPVYLEDVLLSFLPLSHSFERTVGYYVPMMAGATTVYARSIQQLADDLKLVRPTAMIAVPRIFERVYTRIQEKLEQQSAPARALFRAATRLGWRRFCAQQGKAAAPLSRLFWPLLDRTVAARIRDGFGGCLRLIVSGGAALPEPVARTFLGLGVPIVQGYGLTEASPVVSGNPVDDNDPASVGVSLRHVEVAVGADDELLVRGPGVMLGYWNNHAATAEAIDAEGWLHTGDQARIENDHIYITGRIKDIVVLSNGEKLPPGDMEAAIATDTLFEQVLVVGEGKPYLSALVVLNSERWFQLAKDLGLDPFAAESLESEALQRKLLQRIRGLLHAFPGYAKIRRVSPMLEPWTVENGLLTPTLKVRRQQILERFAERIERMYE